MTRLRAASAVLSGTLALAQAALAADSRSEARAAFDEANAAYEAGDVQGALRHMKEAHRLSPAPELLYDVAKLERELGQCRPALDDYRGYLAEARGGPSTDAAARAATELDHECGNAHPGYWTSRRVIGWSAIAAGAAAGTTAVAFSVAARSASADVEGSVKRAQRERTFYDAEDREADGRRDQLMAGLFAVAAGAFATGGVLLLVLGQPAETERAPGTGVSVAPLPGGGEFTYSARF